MPSDTVSTPTCPDCGKRERYATFGGFVGGFALGSLLLWALGLRRQVKQERLEHSREDLVDEALHRHEALHEAPTPGFNRRVTIRINHSPKGKLLAYYWSSGLGHPYMPGSPFGRWIRMGLADALELVGAGAADLDPSSSAQLALGPSVDLAE